MRLIPIGTKTKFGNVAGIHSSLGQRSYFIRNNNGVITLLPEDSMFCHCAPKIVVGMIKRHPTENNSLLIGKPLNCKECGYFEL